MSDLQFVLSYATPLLLAITGMWTALALVMFIWPRYFGIERTDAAPSGKKEE